LGIVTRITASASPPTRRERQREEPARADPLDRTENHQLDHVLRGTAERGADEEDRDRDDEERLAAVGVPSFPYRGTVTVEPSM
jgi:hypothetical protein